MARAKRPLTRTEIQKAKALDKDLTLHDGDGLFLLVKTTGKKIWRFRYQPHLDRLRQILMHKMATSNFQVMNYGQLRAHQSPSKCFNLNKIQLTVSYDQKAILMQEHSFSAAVPLS